jgi:hypothetical protein
MIFYIILCILFLLYIYNKNYEYIINISNKYNILHLVLYSDDEYYNKMYEITSKFYKKFNNVKTIYYKFSSTIENNYELFDDILLIKGNDTFVPGILDKTIKTFKYFENYNFDYIVRSNISSIINFNLINFDNINYGGGNYMTLSNLDPYSGIDDNKYYGIKFFQGTFIIFSKKMFKNIMNNIHFIDMNIIDDVAFGLLIQDHFLNIIPTIIPNFTIVYNLNNLDFNTITCYRNKSEDRNNDIKNMEFIVNSIKI